MRWSRACPLILTALAAAQTPPAALEFEVASLRPAPKMTMAMIKGGIFHSRNDNARYEESNISLLELIAVAYKIARTASPVPAG